MIVDTTVSFHEQRVCMAQQLYESIERKRAKKQKKENHRNLTEESQKGFTYLVESMNRLSVYLKCARVDCHDINVQTSVET